MTDAATAATAPTEPKYKKTDDGRIIVPLDTPIRLGEKLHTEITFRTPKGADFRKLPAEKTMEPIFRLASLCSGQPDILFDSLELSDIAKVMEVVGGFMDGGPETGKT